MSRQTSSLTKGIAAGLIVGTATYMVSHAMGSNSRALRKNAGKAIRMLGSILDNVTSMVR